MVWNDHRTNFVGAARELDEICKFHRRRDTKDSIAYFCSEQGIEWNFTARACTTFWRAVGSRGQKLQTTSQTCRRRRTSHLRGADHHARTSRGMLKFEAADCYARFRWRHWSFDTWAFSGWRSTGGSPRSTGFLSRDSCYLDGGIYAKLWRGIYGSAGQRST